MEVGCRGTQELELLTPNPGSKNIPKACLSSNPAMSPAHPAQSQPKQEREKTLKNSKKVRPSNHYTQ